VVDEYGEKPSLSQILGRSFARAIPFEVFSCLGERGWHDTMSNTYLIKDDHLKELKALLLIDEIGKETTIETQENIRPSF
jgi:hypothetical protein